MNPNVTYYSSYENKRVKIDKNENAYESILNNKNDDMQITAITTNIDNNVVTINKDDSMLIGNKQWDVYYTDKNTQLLDYMKMLNNKLDNVLADNSELRKSNAELRKSNEELMRSNEELRKDVNSLLKQSRYLSKRTIVITCSEFLKWIIGIEFTYEESTLLNNSEFKEKITLLLDEIRDITSLKKRGVAKKTTLYNEGNALLTIRNNYKAHFISKDDLKDELDYVNDLFDLHSEYKKEFAFAYDLVINREKLLKLI